MEKITKGNNSTKNAGGATVVYLCTSSVMFYISTQFCEIISNGVKIIERTRIIHANQSTKCVRNQGRTKGEGWSTKI